MGGNNTKPKVQPNDSKHHSSTSSSFTYAKVKKSKNKTVTSTALVLADSKSSENLKQEFDVDAAMSVIWQDQNNDIKRIIWDYSFTPKWLERPFQFFGSSLEQEILALARYAAPLDYVERVVRAAHAKKEHHLPATLVKAATKAIQNLDVTIRDEKGEVIAEGMAEKLMNLHEVLYPATFPQSLAQVRSSIPVETKEEKDTREATNVAAVGQVFEAIKNNDKNTNAAIKNFEDFAKNLTQLNRLHLLFVAFDVLARRGKELNGEWYGKLADRLCFEVIGIGIEVGFSPRMRKLLEIGVYYILNRTRLVTRSLDIDGEVFIGVRGSDRELGVSSYFDALGARWGVVPAVCGSAASVRLLANLLRAITSALRTYAAIGHSVEDPRRDFSVL